MAQKFRNTGDLDAVAPAGVASGEQRKLSSGRTRYAGFYVPSTPASVDEDLLRSIETPEISPRRRRAAS